MALGRDEGGEDCGSLNCKLATCPKVIYRPALVQGSYYGQWRMRNPSGVDASCRSPCRTGTKIVIKINDEEPRKIAVVAGMVVGSINGIVE